MFNIIAFLVQTDWMPQKARYNPVIFQTIVAPVFVPPQVIQRYPNQTVTYASSICELAYGGPGQW